MQHVDDGTARRGRGRPAGGRRLVDRDLLLDAAERVIALDGNGASLEAIASEAGVTKPMIYARVGSRAELSDALAQRLSDRLLERIRSGVETSSIDRATVARLFQMTVETFAENRELFLYVTRGSGDDTAERTLHLAAQSAQPLAEMLADRRRRHGLDESAAEPWAYGLVGMLNMVSLWWLENGGLDIEVLADQLAELAWSGIGPRRTPR